MHNVNTHSTNQYVMYCNASCVCVCTTLFYINCGCSGGCRWFVGVVTDQIGGEGQATERDAPVGSIRVDYQVLTDCFIITENPTSTANDACHI